MTDKQPNEKQGIINGLDHSKRIIEYETGNVERLKAELLPYLPGYIEPGTVMVLLGRITMKMPERVRLLSQVLRLDDGEWSIDKFKATAAIIYDDGTDGEPYDFYRINCYHPEEVPSE